jgi:hypothetical protein
MTCRQVTRRAVATKAGVSIGSTFHRRGGRNELLDAGRIGARARWGLVVTMGL